MLTTNISHSTSSPKISGLMTQLQSTQEDLSPNNISDIIKQAIHETGFSNSLGKQNKQASSMKGSTLDIKA